jgi:hypothetical protein
MNILRERGNIQRSVTMTKDAISVMAMSFVKGG